LERRAPTQALGDTQSVRGCLFGPYRVAVKGLKRGLLVSREYLLRLRVYPILAQIDCFKRAPMSSLEEPCLDSREF